jgi:hypothetical protein
VSCSDLAPWEVALLVVYCHGWELYATVSRVKRILSELCSEVADTLIEDLEVQGLVTVYNNRLILTKKGLNAARRTCERYSDLCLEIEIAVWSEVSKQFTSLKRFMKK